MIKSISHSLVNLEQWQRLAGAVWYLLKARWTTDVSKELLGSGHTSDSSNYSSPPLTRRQIRTIRRDVRIIELISGFPFRWAFCLQKSRALLWMLKHRGIEACLRIGVRKSGDMLFAHAWVEYDGIVLNDSKDTPGDFSILLPAAYSSIDPKNLEWEY